MINEKLYCSCIFTDTVGDFVEYCCKVDNAFEMLREMKSKYKQSKEKSSLIVNEQYIGLTTTFEIRYSSCVSTGVAKATESPFKGKDIRCNPSYHTASHWFDLNLKLAMGTFASGIRASNMAQLLSFMDIPNAKYLHQRFFKNMETTIEMHLGKVAVKSMNDEIDEEVRLTVNDENKNKKLTVVLTISFDMGWSKRSSGNIYDSISGHTLKIGNLSDKMLTAAVFSKMRITCSKAENISEEPTDHICHKNHEGPSKAMEADAALHLYKSVFYNCNKKLTLKAIVTDDNSSTRVRLRRTSTVNKRGRLPIEMPEP